MGKKRTLNGIPGNLANSYLSIESYFDSGYAEDWLYNIALQESIKEVTVDVLNESVEPKPFSIKPLTFDLPKLKRILISEVENNGFELSFIKSATLNIEIDTESGIVTCKPQLIDIDDRIYSTRYTIFHKASRISEFEKIYAQWKQE